MLPRLQRDHCSLHSARRADNYSLCSHLDGCEPPTIVPLCQAHTVAMLDWLGKWGSYDDVSTGCFVFSAVTGSRPFGLRAVVCGENIDDDC
jgi:hypothetical protein